MAKAELRIEGGKIERSAQKIERKGQASTTLIVLSFAAVYVIWGSTYLAIRYAIETLPPFLMAATRFLVAGLILFVWSGVNGSSIRQAASQWRRAFFVGALLLLCGNGGVTWAEKYVASGLAALLVATEPLWVVILNWGLSHKRPNWKVLLGVLIGVPGVALLVGGGIKGGSSGPTMSLIGAGVVIAAGFAWAGGSVYSARNPIKAPTMMASGMQMLAGGSLLLLTAVITGDFKRLNVGHASWMSIGALVYLIVFGSIVAFTAYSWLLRNVTPARAATYAYVNPVVAVFLGWLLASEPLTPRMLIGAAVIVASVVLITTFGEGEKKRDEDLQGPKKVAPVGVEPEAVVQCPTHPCA